MIYSNHYSVMKYSLSLAMLERYTIQRGIPYEGAHQPGKKRESDEKLREKWAPNSGALDNAGEILVATQYL